MQQQLLQALPTRAHGLSKHAESDSDTNSRQMLQKES